MIVNFKDIEFDKYQAIESPTLLLKTMAGKPIMPISNFTNLHMHFRYNDISEISFDVGDKYEDNGELKDNPCFNEVKGMRIVEVEPFGPFILVNPECSDDGIKNIKSCTIYSLEYELNFKTMPALDGTFMFYDTTNTESNDTMMDVVLECIPTWKIGHIDGNVAARYRTFDNSSDNVYAFMMNTLQEAYSCVFLFDTKTKTINIYDANMELDNIPIFLSHENFIKDTKLTELSDEIVTCLRVYGADDISIRSVNPLNSEKIYNLDYFIESGDIPPDLAEKWNKWKSNYEIYQDLFSNLYSELYVALMEYNAEKIKLNDLNGELSSYKSVMDAYNTDTSGGDHTEEKQTCQNNIDRLTGEITAQEAKVQSCFDKCNAIQTLNEDGTISPTPSDDCLMVSLVKLCAFENYFTKDEMLTLNTFFKEDSLQDSTFVVTDVSTKPEAFKQVTASDGFTLTFTSGNLYRADEYKKPTEEELQNLGLNAENKAQLDSIVNNVESYMKQVFYNIQQAALSLNSGDSTFNLTGTAVNSTISVSDTAKGNGNYDAIITLTINNPIYNTDESHYRATLTVMGEVSGIAYQGDLEGKNSGRMELTIENGLLVYTCDNTIYQTQQTTKELFEFGQDALRKMAFPSYQFSIDSANFLFAQLFEPIKNQIVLGNTINVELSKDIYKQPILTEVEFEYDNWDSLTLVFSDKFRSGDSAFTLADVIGQTTKTSASLDASKFSYAAFKKSNVENDVEFYINSALDLANKHIIDSKNQSVLIDDGGIHLRRRLNGSNTEFELCEVRLTDNRIIFTDDGWKTAGLAIGKINMEDPNDPTKMINTMGVVADSLIGNVLVGNKLTIESTTVDPITGVPDIMQFKVDPSGAFIGNGVVALQGANYDGKLGNKILLDPKYGFMLGNNSIFTTRDGVITPAFIDDNGDTIYDEYGIPKGTNFFLDINTGDAMFRGTIYANNGYFAGTVSANSIIERETGEDFTVKDVVDVVDKVNNGEFDAYNAVIISSTGVTFKEEVTSVLRAELYKAGHEVDHDGTEYTYTWTKHDRYGSLVQTFKKTGKEITITDELVDIKATFTCEITKSDGQAVSQAQITLIRVVDGIAGQDGESSYVHIKYSNFEDGHVMQDNPAIFIGLHTGNTPDAPTDYQKYKWTRLQGVDGKDGIGTPGKNSYVHIAYANSDDGMADFSTSDSSNKKYIGVYTDDNPVDSEDRQRYKWSQIRGEDGADGSPGADGISLTSVDVYYFASTSPTERIPFIPNTFWTTKPPTWTEGMYVWTKSVSTNSNNEQWESEPVCITGSKGATGTPGESATTYYTWIKYADTPTTGMSDQPEGKAYIGLAYNKTTQIESTTYSDYAWSLIKGADGTKGDKGDDGTTYYTWVKYADDDLGANMSDDSTNKKYIGLAYNKTTHIASTNASDYSWALFRGHDGANGKGISSTDIIYQVSTSGKTIPTGEWSATLPEVNLGYYLWTKTTINYTDGTKDTSYLLSRCGSDGKAGDNGVGIATAIVDYQESSSGTTVPTGAWTTTIPEVAAKNFLWTRTEITYTDGSQSYAYSVSRMGASTYFHVKYSSVANPTMPEQISEIPDKYIGTYVDTEEQDSDNPKRYQWTQFKGDQGEQGIPGVKGDTGETYYLHIKYSDDGHTFTADNGETPGAYLGQLVDTVEEDSAVFDAYKWSEVKGIGVSSFTEEYYLSNSATAISGGSWTQNMPAWKEGHYLWVRTRVTYTNGDDDTSAPHLASAINTANSTAVNAYTLANGKNKVFYQDTEPSAAQGLTVGDLWYEQRYVKDANQNIISTDYAMYCWTGSGEGQGWQLSPLGTEALSDGAITADKLAVNSVTAEKIASGSIQTGHLVAGSVTADKIQSESITAEQLAADSVTADKIAAGAITAGHLAAGSLSLGKLDEELKGKINSYDALNTAFNTYLDKESQYLNFDTDNGLVVGANLNGQDTGFRTKITSTEMGFYSDNTKMAYISNESFSISKGEISDTLRIGDFILTSTEDKYFNIECIPKKEGD